MKDNNFFKVVNWNKFFTYMFLSVCFGTFLFFTGIPIVEEWSWWDLVIIDLVLALVPIPVFITVSLPKDYFKETSHNAPKEKQE